MRENIADSTTTTTSRTTYSCRVQDVHPQLHTNERGAMVTISAMLPKRFARLALVTCLLVATAIVYVTLFKHPPPDEVMKMNRGEGRGKDFSLRAFGHGGASQHHPAAKLRQLRRNHNEAADEENGANLEEVEEEEEKKTVWDLLDDDNDGDDKEEERSDGHKHKEAISSKKAAAAEPNKDRDATGEIKGKAVWEKFIAETHHTVIGIVYNACEEPTEQLGTVVMLPDTENGGVKSRTFYNFTLDREIVEGWTFNVDVKYNGQDLYDNWWEVCELEDELEVKERNFVCPVKPGRLSLVKDKHIPGYIPKGHYETKAWVKDSNNTVLVCGYSDFVL